MMSGRFSARLVTGAVAMATLLISASASAQFGLNQKTVPWRAVASGTSGGVQKFTAKLISNQADWANFCRLDGFTESMPQIDFFKERLIVVALGKRNTGGYSVTVTDVRPQTNGTFDIIAVESTPSPNMMTPQAITTPYTVIAVDRQVSTINVKITQQQGMGFGFGQPGGGFGNGNGLPPLTGGYCAFARWSVCNRPRFGVELLNSELELRNWLQSAGLSSPSALAGSGIDRGRPNQGAGAVAPSPLNQIDWRIERLVVLYAGQASTGANVDVLYAYRTLDGALKLGYRIVGGVSGNGQRSAPVTLVRVARSVNTVRATEVRD